MKNLLCLSVLLNIFINISFGQVVTRKTNAFQFDKEKISKRKNPITSSFFLLEPDFQKVYDEDKIDHEKGLPPRFGMAIDVDLGFSKGVWEEVNGGMIWSLKINSKNAKSINLIYDQFFLSDGCSRIVNLSSSI